MEVSYDEALAVCIAHYAERGVEFQPRPPEEVFRIYRNIQKEKEDRKRVVIKEEIVCGMKIRRTELIDDTDPAASQ
ncbi:MAG: hypothetical protein E7437_05425 [Ruminococcaceae bacterium]|jgi:hypothetical protein|nr:hypothetical protein [Oscillospiraceae bacterium]